jgi:alkaline phosphatase D
MSHSIPLSLSIHSLKRCRLPLAVALLMTAASYTAAQTDPLRLSHGPMLGKPTAHSMSGWGRTSLPGQFTVRYGENPNRLDQMSQPATTTIDHDNTGVAQLTGLKPDTRYHYEIVVNGRPHGLPGSFHTLPSSTDTKNEPHNPKGLFNFRFEIGSCANQNPASGIGHRSPTYENLNRDWADKVHFHIMNGDWLYEEQRNFPPEAWRLAQGVEKPPRSVEVMPTDVGVWENHAAQTAGE